ncbi:MAG TPA: hypothetical protein PK228_01840 [Saprospiraceae bacterium]|nr:hypothetical protein [Saprospiraceae bacterium]
MSKTNHGQEDLHPIPAHRPVSGLFFLCTFLLLIGIPASSYVEIGVRACMNGSTTYTTLYESDGMTMQRHDPPVHDRHIPDVPPRLEIKGDEIAGDAVFSQ